MARWPTIVWLLLSLSGLLHGCDGADDRTGVPGLDADATLDAGIDTTPAPDTAPDTALAVDVPTETTSCDNDGVACDDGDPCTLDDHCLAGTCVATLNVCACHVDADCLAGADLCAGAPTCDVDVFPYRCSVQAGTAVACDTSADGPCSVAVCQASTGACVPVALADFSDCSDGAPCTVEDRCVGGVCKPGVDICACQSDADCAGQEDGNLCNGTLYCDKLGFPYGCKITPTSVITCDTSADTGCSHATCVPLAGSCTPTAVANGVACSDGDACSVGDACKAGSCAAGVSVCACKTDADCSANDDGDLCNGTLVCVANACVIDVATVITCEKAQDTACNKATCQAKTGVCALAAVGDSSACSDGDACTVGDACLAGSCAAGLDICQCKQDADCAALEDGNLCNGTLQCVGHQCVLDPATPVSCDGAQDTACSKATCQPKTGACVAVAAATGLGCSDGDACTVGDQCNAGTCVSGVDVCECKSDADCSANDDGNLCNGTFACKSNKCGLDIATIVTCPVGGNAPCQTQSCTPATGLCSAGPVVDGTACDDGNACTSGDSCLGGVCKAGTPSCASPTWSQVYQAAIANQGCSGCHGGYASAAQAYQTVTTDVYCGTKLVVAGDSANSSLMWKLAPGVSLPCGSKMPQGTSGISPKAAADLEAWIAAGAKP